MATFETCVHMHDGSTIEIKHVKKHRSLEGFEIEEHYVLRFGDVDGSNVTMFFPPDMYHTFAGKVTGIIGGIK